MKRNSNSVDGFSPRRRSIESGNVYRPSRRQVAPNTKMSVRGELHSGKDVQQPNHARPRVGINRSDIDESLRDIDGSDADRKRRARKSPQQRARRRKTIKRIVLGLLLIFVLIGGFVGVRALIAGSKMFHGNIFDFAKKASLREDANGRSNIVIFGTSEDSEGGDHPGGNLTDSIMVVSINQKEDNAYMVSIPRDLWVKYEATCMVGNEGKINAVYMCASDDGENEAAGAEAMQQKVGEVLGLDVQYYIHLNNKVMVDVVDALDGVSVKIQSEDPRGIYDPNFDWQCNHQCTMVKYKNGEVAQLDGAHALALARARNAQGGYGLPGGNFDREKNQQKIIRAIQEKAISAGTLMNFGKVTGLIDALGNNLRTNFEIKEVRTLVDVAQKTTGEKLQSIPLESENESVVTTGNYLGQSIVRPIDGLYDYSGIARYVLKKMMDSPVSRESAQVDIYNASGETGAAQEAAEKLEKQGFAIGVIDNAPKGNTALYQIGTGNEATKAKLQELYGVQVTKGDPPMLGSDTTRFVLVIGKTAQSAAR